MDGALYKMNYIDLSCPAEIFRTAPPSEQIPAATLTLFNLSDRVITSVEVLLCLLDGSGEELERLSFRGRALNGRPHSTFLLTVPCAASEGMKAVDATVEKVWYADNEVWRRDPANAVPYTPNDLPVSPALTRLKYAAGETAVGFPSLQEGLWICVCGRPNAADATACARCGQDRNTVFTRFSPEAVDAQVSLRERQLDLNSRNMREDTIRLQKLREEEYEKKKGRRGSRIRVLIALLALPAIVAGILFFVSPWMRLTAAKHSLANGDPESARATFVTLGSFGDAQDLIAESDWQIALKAAESGGGTEELARASAMLRAIPDKPEAIEKADETDLLRAELLLGAGKWQEALDVLEALPEDDERRAALTGDCRMMQARELKAGRQYAEAREIFLSLGDYEGARDQASECLYLPAREMMDEQDWDGAIETFSGILDYRDSRDLSQECHFRKAQELEEAGETDKACSEYLMAGSYPGAVTRYRDLIFRMAEEKFEAGDLKAAHSLYASIPDYPRAAERDLECRYRLAENAADIREYTITLEMLQDIPDDYKDTAKLRTEAAYRKAKSLATREDWEGAAALLKDLDREELKKQFRDIEDLYLEACEKAGIEAYPQESGAPTETPAPEPTPTPVPEETPEGETPAPETPVPFRVTEDEP